MIAVWFIGLFAGLSFAGEKMPWLVIHPTLPAILLAGTPDRVNGGAGRAAAAYSRRSESGGPRARS